MNNGDRPDKKQVRIATTIFGIRRRRRWRSLLLDVDRVLAERDRLSLTSQTIADYDRPQTDADDVRALQVAPHGRGGSTGRLVGQTTAYRLKRTVWARDLGRDSFENTIPVMKHCNVT